MLVFYLDVARGAIRVRSFSVIVSGDNIGRSTYSYAMAA